MTSLDFTIIMPEILLAAYAASLRGSVPAAPKAPEGTEIPPWPEFVPAAKKE